MGSVSVESVSARAQWLRAMGPRWLWLAMVTLLALAGLRHVVLPPRPLVLEHTSAARATVDPAPADAFAQAFARAYLTFDARQPQSHDQAVAPFLAPGVDLAGTVTPASGPAQSVIWTAVAAHAHPAAGSGLITVAVALAGEAALRYLAVPVASGAGGSLAVTGFPALVAPPPLNDRAPPPNGDDVSDSALRTVAVRALSAYLRGSADQLDADLLPGTHASVPASPLTIEDIASITWTSANEIALDATVHDPAGTGYELRYLLTVTRRDRWYVLAINPSDPTGGSS